MEKFGAICKIVKLPESINESDFVEKLNEITKNKNVHGCFVQLPLPNQLKNLDIANLIPANKDVDGFSKENIFKLFQGDIGDKALLPCTPKGIITLLNHYQRTSYSLGNLLVLLHTVELY